MKISREGINFIKREEEGKNYAKKSYKCPAGYWTIGWGCRFWENGKEVKENETINQERAEVLLGKKIYDIAEYHIKQLATVDLTQHEYDSLCSLIFNVGPGAFKKSKALKYLNEKNIEKFKYEVSDRNNGFTKINGKISEGLHKRRIREMELFINKKY